MIAEAAGDCVRWLRRRRPTPTTTERVPARCGTAVTSWRSRRASTAFRAASRASSGVHCRQYGGPSSWPRRAAAAARPGRARPRGRFAGPEGVVVVDMLGWRTRCGARASMSATRCAANAALLGLGPDFSAERPGGVHSPHSRRRAPGRPHLQAARAARHRTDREAGASRRPATLARRRCTTTRSGSSEVKGRHLDEWCSCMTEGRTHFPLPTTEHSTKGNAPRS